MRNAIRFAAALGVVFAWACGGEPATAPPSPPPQAAISDGAHGGGNQHFYFLPPMVPAPMYTGDFDATLSPTVAITVDGVPLATLAATWDGVNPWYQVNWHTGEYALDPARTYRITVKIGAYALGFADVDLVANGRELRNVNTDESIPLLDGRTLPIKFRIERGAVPQGVLLLEYGQAGQTLVLLQGDGSGSTTLPVFGLYHADLSPDRTRLIYTRAGSQSLWVSSLDGSGETPVSTYYAPQYTPRWSMDAAKIVWTREAACWGGPCREVFTMNADGSGVTRLTSNSVWDQQGRWSPDASRIVFQSNRDGPFDLYVMNADGSGIVRLTTGAYAGAPEFSPDGQLVAYVAQVGSSHGLFLMNADGSGQRLIIADDCFIHTTESGVHFSPDGTRLAFPACFGGALRDVYTIGLDGSGLTRLTDTPTIDEYVRSWR